MFFSSGLRYLTQSCHETEKRLMYDKPVIVHTRNSAGADWRIDPNGKQQSADGKNEQGVIRPTRLSS